MLASPRSSAHAHAITGFAAPNARAAITAQQHRHDSRTTASAFSSSLAGDVTGNQGATVVSKVGGQTAANIASGTSAANAATSANSVGTIVARDGSGNFSAGTLMLNGNLDL